MSTQAHMTGGTRLAYVVHELEGTVRRPVHIAGKKGGVSVKEVEEPAGYLVYFPRGHVLRVRTRKELRQYGLDQEAPFINMQGLHDPRSPLGKLMTSQDESVRRGAFQSLETHVMQLAQAKSGKIEVTREAVQMEEHEREDA